MATRWDNGSTLQDTVAWALRSGGANSGWAADKANRPPPVAPGPFDNESMLTPEQRAAALPYVEPSGPNAGTVLPPVPGAGTANAMQLLQPQAARPGTVAFQPPGGGVIVVPQSNVRGGGSYAPTDRGYVGQGQIPLGPAVAPPAAPPVAPPQAIAETVPPPAAPMQAQAPTPVPVAAPPAAPVSAPVAPTRWWEARGPQMVPKAPPPVAPSVIAQREAQNSAIDMRRAGIERGMTPGGVRSGATSVWNRTVAGTMQQQDTQAAEAKAAELKANNPKAVAGSNIAATFDRVTGKWTTTVAPQVASGAGGAVATDAQGRVTMGQVPAVKGEPTPDVTERLKNLAPLFKQLTGTDVDPMVFMQVNSITDPAERKLRMDQLMSGADAEGKAAMLSVIDTLLKQVNPGAAIPPPKKPVNPAPATTGTATPATGATKPVRVFK